MTCCHRGFFASVFRKFFPFSPKLAVGNYGFGSRTKKLSQNTLAKFFIGANSRSLLFVSMYAFRSRSKIIIPNPFAKSVCWYKKTCSKSVRRNFRLCAIFLDRSQFAIGFYRFESRSKIIIPNPFAKSVCWYKKTCLKSVRRSCFSSGSLREGAVTEGD